MNGSLHWPQRLRQLIMLGSCKRSRSPPSSMASSFTVATAHHCALQVDVNAQPAVTRLAVVASVRHRDTDYDSLLMAGLTRAEARECVTPAIGRVIAAWRAPGHDRPTTVTPTV